MLKIKCSFEEVAHRRNVEVLVVAHNIRRKRKRKPPHTPLQKQLLYSITFRPVSAFVKSHCQVATGVVDIDEEQVHTWSLSATNHREEKRERENQRITKSVHIVFKCKKKIILNYNKM